MIKNRKLIAETIRKVFADMFFIDVEEVDALVLEKPWDIIIKTEIIKPFQGFFYLYLNQDIQKAATENIFAENFENLDSKKIEDCLLELLNVISGNILRVVFQDEKEKHYEVKVPQVLRDESIAENEITLFFQAEDSFFQFSVQLFEQK